MPKFFLIPGETVAVVLDWLDRSRGLLTKDEQQFAKKFKNTLTKLSENPMHSSLHSHKIDALSDLYGVEIWQSYMENKTPGARRIFWCYGPDRGEITILGFQKHPNKQYEYKAIEISFPAV